jgi:hypothetical protein
LIGGNGGTGGIVRNGVLTVYSGSYDISVNKTQSAGNGYNTVFATISANGGISGANRRSISENGNGRGGGLSYSSSSGYSEDNAPTPDSGSAGTNFIYNTNFNNRYNNLNTYIGNICGAGGGGGGCYTLDTSSSQGAVIVYKNGNTSGYENEYSYGYGGIRTSANTSDNRDGKDGAPCTGMGGGGGGLYITRGRNNQGGLTASRDVGSGGKGGSGVIILWY